MDSLTDEQNTWFNAVRSEDSHNYSSATLLYMEDATQSLVGGLLARAAISTTCGASCLVNLGNFEDAVNLYSVAASLYERNADLAVRRSIRESLWMLLHAYDYYTLASDYASSERVSKKYGELAKRVDRFETRAIIEILKNRMENVQLAKLKLESNIKVSPNSNFDDFQIIQHSIRNFLQLVRTVSVEKDELDHVASGSESDFNEGHIVS